MSGWRPVTGVVVALAAVAGLVIGAVVDRAAATFPWDGVGTRAATAVRRPALELVTATVFALVALRFGASWELPAFLAGAGAGVLLAVIDVQHRLLPDRVVVPALLTGGLLLTGAAVADGRWDDLLRAGLGAGVLFVLFLVLALISPSALGMGDVKLAALLGLYLGWLGWDAVLLGAAAGFVVQAVLALLLLATRRIGLRGELPFGPAMLLGAGVAVGWSSTILG
ncbi:A24 family peptidase [Blastococcus goldschmidtiae]|uniref:A24 family peptidase n=1 Tax=Blastococcus goldschmidtiae TaxID=3075546 RepID=A0ABU2K7P5_9ACTN|nr:A24 family peptidase [Blastococcus sp. DSM 46792]MDT0276220.1 A24 family peptidase [Blastococcus sp. DSM 46792]